MGTVVYAPDGDSHTPAPAPTRAVHVYSQPHRRPFSSVSVCELPGRHGLVILLPFCFQTSDVYPLFSLLISCEWQAAAAWPAGECGPAHFPRGPLGRVDTSASLTE